MQLHSWTPILSELPIEKHIFYPPGLIMQTSDLEEKWRN